MFGECSENTENVRRIVTSFGRKTAESKLQGGALNAFCTDQFVGWPLLCTTVVHQLASLSLGQREFPLARNLFSLSLVLK